MPIQKSLHELHLGSHLQTGYQSMDGHLKLFNIITVWSSIGSQTVAINHSQRESQTRDNAAVVTSSLQHFQQQLIKKRRSHEPELPFDLCFRIRDCRIFRNSPLERDRGSHRQLRGLRDVGVRIDSG